MAKRRYADRGKITRTITETSYDITYVNIKTKEIVTTAVKAIGKLSGAEMLANVPDGCIGLEVTNVSITENIYVCEIAEFLKVAHVIPDAEAETVDE